MALNITKLDSGLTVLTYKMPDIKSVAINLIVTVGSRFETPEENGISHFLEHMAFKGTKTRSARQIAEAFDSIGGQFNAYTSKERTVYHTKVLSENTETALDIIADIIQNSLYTQSDIKKEYDVICQEISQTLDSPDDLAFEKLYDVAFPNQAFGRSILGTPEVLSKFTTESFSSYVNSHYHSDNMFLSVAGDVDHATIVDLAKKLFHISNNTALIAATAKYKGGNSSIITKQNLEHSTIIIAFETIPYTQKPSFYHAQILSLILGGGMSSRLFQKIREDRGLSYSVGAFNSSYADTGLFSLYAGTSHENLALVGSLLLEETAKIITSVTTIELERAKTQIKSNIVMAEEKSSYKSEEIGKTYAIFGKYEGIDKILEQINSTTITDITKIADTIFSTKIALSVVTDKDNRLDASKFISLK
jgi:predicted Zn-dependent peptidase